MEPLDANVRGNLPIYLDYNATTPIAPLVAKAMMPFLKDYFGNPSSAHYYGQKTNSATIKARQQVADMIRCKPDEVVFTSGGTESNNYALRGVAGAYKDKGNHIITSNVEHPAILEVCKYLEEKQGCKITYLPVDEFGMISPEQVEDAITDQTILVTLMHANNEVGTLNPIREIAEIAHKRDVLVHTDAAQSVGKVPVYVDELGVDLLSIAGHKLYAPKGIGALYIRGGVTLEKLIHGAGQESGHRAGTENILEMVGLGAASELVSRSVENHVADLKKLRDRLETGLKNKFGDLVRVNGHLEKRLPNTASVSFKGLRASDILGKLTGIATSAGAACHSDTVNISYVLEALNIPLEYAVGTIRFSVGRFSTSEEIERALDEIINVIESMQ